jgi:predicted aspartyl protease
MPAYPLLELVLEVGTWETDAEAYPDTGFEGGLCIPIGVGREILAAPFMTPLRLADGSQHEVKTWRGRIDLQGHVFDVEVAALGNRYLLGREVLDRLEICFEYGQRVRLQFRS